MGAGAGREPAVEVVQAAPGPYGGHGRGQPPARGRGVVGVGGGHDVDAGLDGDLGQGVVAGRVERVPVIAQLHGHVGAAEGGDQRVELAGGGGRPVTLEGRRHGALAATGEDEPVVTVCLLPGDAVVDGLALLGPGELRGADRRGQPGVALGVPGEDEQVGALGVGHAVLRLRQTEGQLCAEHGGQAHGPGCLGEADHPVETVVIGDGQGLQAQPGRLLGQLLGMAGPVEEAERGVAVQLGVGRGVDPPLQPGRRHVGRPDR